MDQSKCNRCKINPPEEDRLSCFECLAKQRVSAVERRQRLKTANLCDSCGQNQRREGGMYCEQCLAKQKLLREVRRDNSQCIHCGAECLGSTRCLSCIERTTENHRKLRKKWREEGLCIKCGKEALSPHVKCSTCLESHRKSYHKKKLENLEKGLCSRCDEIILPNNSKCRMCYLKHIATKRTGSVENWQAIEQKFLSQNGLCPYSGVKLVLGLNADLDHRVPVSLGGSNDISNLQWLYRPINTMKWNLSEVDFLETIKLVSRFQDSQELQCASLQPIII